MDPPPAGLNGANEFLGLGCQCVAASAFAPINVWFRVNRAAGMGRHLPVADTERGHTRECPLWGDASISARPEADGQRHRPTFHIAAVPDRPNDPASAQSSVGRTIHLPQWLADFDRFIYAALTRSNSPASKSLHLNAFPR